MGELTNEWVNERASENKRHKKKIDKHIKIPYVIGFY